MQFSDSTNKLGLVEDVRFLTRTDSNEYPTADITRSINAWLHKAVTVILESQDDWEYDDINHTDFPIMTTSLVASQRDYSLPASEKVLKIKRVDVTYDGTTYYRATPFDNNESSSGYGNATNEDKDFNKTQPYYDVKFNSIFVYPLANSTDVTNGATLRVEWFREATEFTASDTTKEPGIDEPFHRYLSIGAALDYAVAFDIENKNNLAQLASDYEARMRSYYGKKNNDKEKVLKSAYINYE